MIPGGQDNAGYLEPGDTPIFGSDRVCATCKRTFTPKYPNQTYCSLYCLPQRASWDRDARRRAIVRHFPGRR